MSNNGKLMALATVIIAVMVASVSLAEIDTHNSQGNSDKAPLKGTSPESEKEYIMEFLGVTTLDKDTIVSTVLTKLILAAMPAMSVPDFMIGDTITIDLQVQTNDGKTATFHSEINHVGDNKYEITVKNVTVGDKSYKIEMSIVASASDKSHMTISLVDGGNTLVTYAITVKEAPYDDDTDSAAVKLVITSVELQNGKKFTPNQIVYFDIRGGLLDYVTVIIPNNEMRNAVLFHYHNTDTDASFNLDLESVEYKSNVIYVWCGTYILEEKVTPVTTS